MDREKTKYIVVHCSATPAFMNIGVREIDRWHRERGFWSIGYHFVIRRDGSLEHGRALEKVGAHAKGHNRTTIGVCLVGGVDGDTNQPAANYTPQQWASLKALIVDLQAMYPDARVTGHRDLDRAKDCPCFNVSAWFNEVTAHD